MKAVALEGRALSWQVGERTVLRDVSLAVERGECIAVVGPNGAGKTSLLRIFTGLLRPTGGQVLLNGERLDGLSRRAVARRLAYLPQIRPNRVPLTVQQMVMLGRYPYWRRRQLAPAASDFEAVRSALSRVGLERLAGRQMDRLSGGEQQRVYLASCLAQGAGTLILDEPTTYLDPRHQQEMAGLVMELSRESAHSIVCATHDLNFASLIADRVIGLRQGSVAAVGAPAQVLTPAVLGDLFTARFDTFVGGERPLTVLRLEGE